MLFRLLWLISLSLLPSKLLSNALIAALIANGVDANQDILAGGYTFSIGVHPSPLPDSTQMYNNPSVLTPVISPFAAPLLTGPVSDSSAILGKRGTTDDENPWGTATSVDTARRSLFSPGQSTTINTVSISYILSNLGHDLQCSSTAALALTNITANDAITALSLVQCPLSSSTSTTTNGVNGICHSSGYSTFAVNGSKLCCPDKWSTSLIVADVYCITLVDLLIEPETTIGETQASITSVGASITAVGGLEGVVFTRAGVVASQAISTATASTNGVESFNLELWKLRIVAFLMAGILIQAYMS